MDLSGPATRFDFFQGVGPHDTSLVETAPVGLAVVDSTGCISYVNEHVARIFASSKAVLTGRSVDMLIPEDLRQTHALERMASTKAPRTMNMGAGRELRARRDDGTEFPIEVALPPITFLGRTATLATIANVSERSARDAAFRQVFEHGANGLTLVTSGGIITRTNDRFNRMFGYQPEELINQAIELLIPHRFRQQHVPLREGYAAAPSARIMGLNRDLTGPRKDGVEFPIEIGLSSFETPTGRLIFAAVVDIKERKRSELKLREVNAQLEEFAYVVAHDQRSPLRGVANLIDFVEDDLGATAPPSAVRNLQRMRDRVASSERLIEDLLVYARSGRRTTKFVTINLPSIIDEIVASQNFPATTRIRTELASTEFEGARTPLTTVLRNLLGNAVNHHDRAEANIIVRSRDEGDQVAIDVIDDGPGIPEAVQERVFRLFQTLSKTEKRGQAWGSPLRSVWSTVMADA